MINIRSVITYRILSILFSLFLITACSPGPDQNPGLTPTVGASGSATIDDVVIQQLAGDETSYQAVIRGHLSDTCTRISEARSERAGNLFTIRISTAQIDKVNCLEEQIDFERVIPLDIEAAGFGSFTLRAGAINRSFEIAGATPATEEEQTTATGQAETPAGPGSISGVVWHDECINQTQEAEDQTGCVESGNTLVADGNRSEDETGIENIRVDLGSGPCPSVEMANTTTSVNGGFVFNGLVAGVYCVSINSAIPDNQETLGDGVWSTTDGGSGNVTVELAQGESVSDVEFGWDYISQPETGIAETPEENCIARAAYYGDINIPDNTVMEPGEVFTKKWRVRNEGTCVWGPGYALVFGNGDQMGGASSSPLPQADPGDIVEVSVDLTAPQESGYYRGNWGFSTAKGQPFAVGATGTTPVWVKIVVSFYSGSSTPPSGGLSTCGEDLNSDYIGQLLEMVNAQRAQRNLAPLELQDRLSAAAQGHSSDMACNDFLSHTGTGNTTYRDRVRAEGYNSFLYLTENIYAGNPNYGGTPDGAMEWWMNSQVHRDAILNPDVSEIGIGYAFSTNSTYGAYYTLVFAQPVN